MSCRVCKALHNSWLFLVVQAKEELLRLLTSPKHPSSFTSLLHQVLCLRVTYIIILGYFPSLFYVGTQPCCLFLDPLAVISSKITQCHHVVLHKPFSVIAKVWL